MAKKKQKGKLTDVDPTTGEVDPRPESSPFESPSIQIYFSDGPTFIFPSSLLKKSIKLSEGSSRFSLTLRLNDVTSAVGHVLFYYLLTDTYQCLRPKGNTPDERLVDEFSTSARVYVAARKYELPSLLELAQGEMQRLADGIPFPRVLNLLQQLQLDPSAEDTWVSDYVQSGLKNLFENPSTLLEYSAPQAEPSVVSFSDIILKSLAELLANDLAPARRDTVAPSAQFTEPTVFEPELEPELAAPLDEAPPTDASPDERPLDEVLQANASPEEGPLDEVLQVDASPEEPPEEPPQVEPWPENAAVPEPEPEPVYGFLNPPKKKKKKKKGSIWDVEPEPELVEAEPPEAGPWPETAAVAESEPELMDFSRKPSKKKKKKKGSIWDVEPEPESVEAEPWPEIAAAPESELEPVDDSRKASKKKKKSKGLQAVDKLPASVTEPVAEPVAEPESVGDWSFWASSQKNNGSKTAELYHEPPATELDPTIPEPEPEPPVDDSWGSSWGLSTNYKKKKKQSKIAGNGWPVVENQNACVYRSEHMLGDGWKECSSCRENVGELSLQYTQMGVA